MLILSELFSIFCVFASDLDRVPVRPSNPVGVELSSLSSPLAYSTGCLESSSRPPILRKPRPKRSGSLPNSSGPVSLVSKHPRDEVRSLAMVRSLKKRRQDNTSEASCTVSSVHDPSVSSMQMFPDPSKRPQDSAAPDRAFPPVSMLPQDLSLPASSSEGVGAFPPSSAASADVSAFSLSSSSVVSGHLSGSGCGLSSSPFCALPPSSASAFSPVGIFSASSATAVPPSPPLVADLVSAVSGAGSAALPCASPLPLGGFWSVLTASANLGATFTFSSPGGAPVSPPAPRLEPLRTPPVSRRPSPLNLSGVPEGVFTPGVPNSIQNGPKFRH